jgi:hypothetical protein
MSVYPQGLARGRFMAYTHTHDTPLKKSLSSTDVLPLDENDSHSQ